MARKSNLIILSLQKRVITVETKFFSGNYTVPDDMLIWKHKSTDLIIRNPQIQAKDQACIIEKILIDAGYTIKVIPLVILANGYLENYMDYKDITPIYNKDKIDDAIKFIANPHETLYKGISVIKQKEIAEYLLSLDISGK